MAAKVPAAELMNRLKKFTTLMDIKEESWRYIFIFNPLTAYYLTGTMQDGVLFIQKGEEPEYFVRRSADKAEIEARCCKVSYMETYNHIRDKLNINSFFPIYIDTEFTPIALFERFNKAFEFNKIYSCDHALKMCRSVKSKYEIDIIKKAGKIHQNIMEEIVPALLKEDMTEFEASTLIYNEFLKAGHQGITRMQTAGMEFVTLNTAFGENSLHTYRINSPVGVEGRYTSAPFLGSIDTTLKQNDLINITSYFGIEGYYSGLTTCYAYNSLLDYIRRQHSHCTDLRDIAKDMLKPGVKPMDIYAAVMDHIHPEIQGIFMGIGETTLKHIGHGVGLTIDEEPVIKRNGYQPLQENMVVTLSCQAALEGYGMAGVQHTYIVTTEGGESVNGDGYDIIVAGKYL